MKEKSLGLIQEHLLHADGVRLMDKGVNYRGGINTYFMRAETAANFGREIGLQYCHAHIRYCEALAKVGYGDELYKEKKPVFVRETNILAWFWWELLFFNFTSLENNPDLSYG